VRSVQALIVAVMTYGDDVRTYVVGLCEVCSSTDSGGDDVRTL